MLDLGLGCALICFSVREPGRVLRYSTGDSGLSV